MNVLIIGLGKTGFQLAQDLAAGGNHRVAAIEVDESRAAAADIEGFSVVAKDACEPAVLEQAGIRNTELVVATTGDDEDNLVVAQLAKFHFGVPRVIARLNNPRNGWLYTPEWGIDIAVSPTAIITKIIEEEMSLGDLVTLLKLKGGEMALVEITLKPGSKAAGKLVSELSLPPGVVIAAVMRAGEVIVPGGPTRLEAGDELLAVTSVRKEADLLEALN